jgi:hypothetical protein
MNSMIKLQYSLNLPEGVNAGDKPTSKTHQVKIDAPTSTDGQDANLKKTYYDALRNALEEARSQVGDELTMWRDVVGKKELSKELRKGNGDEEEEEEGDSL